jgi:predicted nucleic acid-binding Zn ribbon protein
VKRRRDAPRSLADSVRELRATSAPQTPLAAVQGVWVGALGPAVAAQAKPVFEKDGVITVACRSATWAQELDLMQVELLESLQNALGSSAGSSPITGLRFTADAARHEE